MTQSSSNIKQYKRWRSWQAHWQNQLTPLQKVDTWLFAKINNLPHPIYLDQFMRLLAEVMNRGDGWLFGLLLASYRDEAQGHSKSSRIMRRVAPVLWLASATVEFPLKSLFRRKRPYTQLAQAILVGAQPQRHSFPSGHAASAFAGAWLLSKYYPRWRIPFYLLALLVAFCRIYSLSWRRCGRWAYWRGVSGILSAAARKKIAPSTSTVTTVALKHGASITDLLGDGMISTSSITPSPNCAEMDKLLYSYS